MPQPVSGLPHAQGKSFDAIDDYLDHLRSLAPQDRPYYEEIRPGVFRHVAGRLAPGETPSEETFTRQELAALYGFEL